VKIPAAAVVGVVPAGGQSQAWVLLTDGQSVFGALAEPEIRIELSAGSELKVPLGSLRQCGFRITEDKPIVAPKRAAMLLLASGERLAWESLGQTLHLQTAFGRAALPAGGLLRIDSAGLPGGPFRAMTANGSTLTGMLAEEQVRLKLALGPELAVPPERLRSLTFDANAVRSEVDATMILRSGDRLLGRVLQDRLTVQTEFGEVKLPPGSVNGLRFDANRPGAVSAVAWDGARVEGRLGAKAVEFQVGAGGPRLSVLVGQIVSIERSVALPPPDVLRKIEALIVKLGAASYKHREAATQDLIAMGKAIVPLLKKHRNDPDPEVRQRIELILEKLAPESGKKESPQRDRLIIEGFVRPR
ncbi:MAG TPA: hypothetical protein VNA25_24615, partial [Phycisphaerae bacterium]|nr:hypothetical protein [Phycisphaerae bacterium]